MAGCDVPKTCNDLLNNISCMGIDMKFIAGFPQSPPSPLLGNTLLQIRANMLGIAEMLCGVTNAVYSIESRSVAVYEEDIVLQLKEENQELRTLIEKLSERIETLEKG